MATTDGVQRSRGPSPAEAAPRAAGAPGRRVDAWIGLGLFLAAAGVFAGTLGHGYTYDDVMLTKNPHASGPLALGVAFGNDFYTAVDGDGTLYRPLAIVYELVTHAADRALDPAGKRHVLAHAGIVLAHATATLLGFLWLRRLGLARLASAAAALLFAVHPIHTEAVANVTNGSEALAAAAGFGALLAFAAGRPWAGAASLFAALWFKESALVFLAVAVLATWIFARADLRRGLVRLAPAAAVTLLWLLLRAYAIADAGPRRPLMENPLLGVGELERVINAGRIQLDYLRLLCAPLHLSSDYSYRQIPLVPAGLDARFVLFVVLALATLAGAWRLRARAPFVALALGGYALAFAPTANLLFPIGTILGERLAYVPSFFWALLVATSLGLVGASARARGAWCAGVVVIAGLFAWKSVLQSRIWSDDATLFAAQVVSAPDSAKAHMNHAITLSLAGRPAESLPHYDRSLALFPEHAHTWYCKGNALYRMQGDAAEVIRCYQEAVRIAPAHQDARANLALCLIRAGRLAEAAAQHDALQALNPSHPTLPVIRERLAKAAAPR